MKKLGGYKLIDFGGVDISTSKTISGIYEKIEKTEKRIVGCNLKLGTTTFKELTLDVKKDGTNLVLSNSIIKVTITNANVVVGEEASGIEVVDLGVVKYKSDTHKQEVDGIFNKIKSSKGNIKLRFTIAVYDEDNQVYINRLEDVVVYPMLQSNASMNKSYEQLTEFFILIGYDEAMGLWFLRIKNDDTIVYDNISIG